MNTPLSKPQRLLSLDVLRGITIAGMIMVNNPGSWGSIYAPLGHASWNGLTPTDLVFPFFMFIMGVSMYISISKFKFEFSSGYFTKLLRRSVVIFLIGMGIAWLSTLCYSVFNISSDASLWERFSNSVLPFDRIRILGVMQRLAITSFFASLIVVLFKPKRILPIAAGILLVYWVILYFGDGFELSTQNIIARVDASIFGTAHMYKDALPSGERIAFDPEGLLSNLPGIAHVMLGIYCGKLIMTTPDLAQKMVRIFLLGTIMLGAGWLLSYGCPINKKIWSPTYVLVTCGMASLLLSLLIWIIDVRGKKRWSVFFESFGINPLFMYVMGAVLSILFGSIRFPYGEGVISIKGFMYNSLLAAVGDPYFASLLFAVIFVLINWVIGNQLYRRKIYIKI